MRGDEKGINYLIHGELCPILQVQGIRAGVSVVSDSVSNH